MTALLVSLVVGGVGPILLQPGNAQPSGVSATGACATQVTGNVICYDNNGGSGGQLTSTTDPDGFMLRPQACSPSDGTCAAGNLNLYGGQDTTTIAIDGADPSSSCAGDNDTVTVTVLNQAGASTATILTEGTEWTATASVADTCASLAAAVSALPGVSASCTSPDVRIQLDTTTGRVALAESTAGCTTVATGTYGDVIAFARRLCVDSGGSTAGGGNECIGTSGGQTLQLITDGSSRAEINNAQVIIASGNDLLPRGGLTNDVGPIAIEATGLKPVSVTADPCADTTKYPAGAVFYNSTSNVHCFCNGAGADIRLVDNSTACF